MKVETNTAPNIGTNIGMNSRNVPDESKLFGTNSTLIGTDRYETRKVCMVCFDGSTDEKNLIVYCDGCNMSVHMDCYGIQDAEADFCCDRCTKLRELEKES